MTTPDQDRWLRSAFEALPDVQVPADLMRRVAMIPLEHEQRANWAWLRGRWVGLGWGLCGALGVVFGLWLEPNSPGALDEPWAEDAALGSTLNMLSAQQWEGAFTQDLEHGENSL